MLITTFTNKNTAMCLIKNNSLLDKLNILILKKYIDNHHACNPIYKSKSKHYTSLTPEKVFKMEQLDLLSLNWLHLQQTLCQSTSLNRDYQAVY